LSFDDDCKASAQVPERPFNYQLLVYLADQERAIVSTSAFPSKY